MSGFRNWRAGSGCPSGTLEKFEALLTALRNCLVGKSAGFGIWPNFPQRVRRLCGLLHTDDDGGTCLRQSICPAHFGTCTIARRRGRGVLEIQLLNGRWIEIPRRRAARRSHLCGYAAVVDAAHNKIDTASCHRGTRQPISCHLLLCRFLGMNPETG